MAIDSYAPNASEEHIVALVDGQAFFGDRELTPPPPGPDIEWTDLTEFEDYPEDACDITIDEQANRARIKVITTEGDIHELRCRTNRSEPVCGDWNELEAPPVMNDTSSLRS